MRNEHRYAENWKDEIRPAILKRDNYRCQNCNKKHRTTYVFPKHGEPFEIPKKETDEWKSEGLKVYRVFLQVAHLDHDPSNNNPENLRSLCPACHLNNDRTNNMILRKSKLKTL